MILSPSGHCYWVGEQTNVYMYLYMYMIIYIIDIVYRHTSMQESLLYESLVAGGFAIRHPRKTTLNAEASRAHHLSCRLHCQGNPRIQGDGWIQCIQNHVIFHGWFPGIPTRISIFGPEICMQFRTWEYGHKRFCIWCHALTAGRCGQKGPRKDPYGLDSQESYESGVQMLRNIAFFLANFTKHTKPFSPLIAYDSNSRTFFHQNVFSAEARSLVRLLGIGLMVWETQRRGEACHFDVPIFQTVLNLNLSFVICKVMWVCLRLYSSRKCCTLYLTSKLEMCFPQKLSQLFPHRWQCWSSQWWIGWEPERSLFGPGKVGSLMIPNLIVLSYVSNG